MKDRRRKDKYLIIAPNFEKKTEDIASIVWNCQRERLLEFVTRSLNTILGKRNMHHRQEGSLLCHRCDFIFGNVGRKNGSDQVVLFNKLVPSINVKDLFFGTDRLALTVLH